MLREQHAVASTRSIPYSCIVYYLPYQFNSAIVIGTPAPHSYSYCCIVRPAEKMVMRAFPLLYGPANSVQKKFTTQKPDIRRNQRPARQGQLRVGCPDTKQLASHHSYGTVFSYLRTSIPMYFYIFM